MAHDLHASAPVWAVVLVAAAAGAVCDVRTGRIPNALTLPLLACGVAWSVFAGGWAGLGGSLGAGLLVGLPFVVLYAMGAGGAGDAKLMMALGAWLGLTDGLVALVAVLAAGAVLGLLTAAHRGRFRDATARVGQSFLYLLLRMLALPRRLPSLPPRTESMIPMPYGLSIFAGTCLAALGVFVWT